MAHRVVVACFTCVLVFASDIAFAQGGPPVYFRGLKITPLGGATVSIDNTVTPTELVVANLMSSADGFEIDLGDAAQGTRSKKAPSTSGPTNNLKQIFLAFAAGSIGIGTLTIEHSVGGADEIDFSNAFLNLVEVWDEGVLVTQISGQSGPVGRDAEPLEWSIEVQRLPAFPPDPILPATMPTTLVPCFTLRYPADTEFSIGSPAQMVSGDELRFFPENPTSVPDNVARVQVTYDVPRGPETARFDDLALLHFGRQHRATADAILRTSMPTGGVEEWPSIEVDIPTDGDGGVVILNEPLPSSGGGNVDCLVWDIKQGKAGTNDTFGVLGSLSSLPGVETTLGEIVSVCSGSNWAVTPDFSPLGTTAYDLTLYDDTGAQVLAVSGYVGSFVVSGLEMPVEQGVCFVPGSDLHLSLEFPSNRTITVPGHGAYQAMKAKASTTGVTSLDAFFGLSRQMTDVAAGGMELIMINGEFDFPGSGDLRARTPDLAYFTHADGFSILHTDPDPTTATTTSRKQSLYFPESMLEDSFGVEWLSLGPPGSAAVNAEFDVELERDNGDDLTIRMVDNGSGADLFIDPPVGVEEVEVVERDKLGRVKVKFTWTTFSAPVMTLPDFPVAAFARQRLAQSGEPQDGLTLDFGYEMNLPDPTGPAGGSMLPNGVEYVDVWRERNLVSGLPPRLVLKPDGFGPIVVLHSDPVLVTVNDSPRARTNLHPAYPNPFNPRTTLAFQLAETGDVSLRIYAVDGSLVNTVHEGRLPAGFHAFPWDGRNRHGNPVASGIYLVQLRSPDGVNHAKLNLLK